MNDYSIYTEAFATDAKLPRISLREVKLTGDLDIFEWFSALILTFRPRKEMGTTESGAQLIHMSTVTQEQTIDGCD
jgi:hypothetical protein